MEDIKINKEAGLSEEEAARRLAAYGENSFHKQGMPEFIRVLTDIIREPMFLLLMLACLVYFFLREYVEGYTMLAAIVLISGISFFQELRSSRALRALKMLNEPLIVVIRNGIEKAIHSKYLVPGDVFMLQEGNHIAADARVLQNADLSVDESLLTGESFPVSKEKEDDLFQGTLVSSGYCAAEVTATGDRTRLSRLGKSITDQPYSKTTMQRQVAGFVSKMALLGLFMFLLVFFINFLKRHDLVSSILYSLTLAMSIIPEEIPVAFSTFMALGAYRMSKAGMIVRLPQIMESLGQVSCICLDKTGTLTENKMTVVALYDYATKKTYKQPAFADAGEVLYYSWLASEVTPFDQMEKAIHEAFGENGKDDTIKKIYDYPLSGKPPMMTHVYTQNGRQIIAAKGAPERILRVCNLSENEQKELLTIVKEMAGNGWRILGVCKAGESAGHVFPAEQDEFNWKFAGFIAFNDPLRKNISGLLTSLATAGIKTKILTGDATETAQYIAREAGLSNHAEYATGDEVLAMSESRLRNRLKEVNLFSRMSPEAKLKVIHALKANGEIVAMTGDGINDGPALKAAHVGIALRKDGNDLSVQAAGLVITDDDLHKIPLAIQHGRRIHANLKKAIRYIISIHIPIILTITLPLLFNWEIVNIFTPIHVIFLELVMGPTCSVFFENEPAEPDVMKHFTGRGTGALFGSRELMVSIIQGLVISLVIMIAYYFGIRNGFSAATIRTHVFLILILSNIFLTFVTRSFTQPVFRSITYKNDLVWAVVGLSLLFLAILIWIPDVRAFFGMEQISFQGFLILLIIALAGVLWIEVPKAILQQISLRRKITTKAPRH